MPDSASQWTQNVVTNLNEVENWPHDDIVNHFGEVAGVATSDSGVHLFHRGNVVWDERYFSLYLFIFIF